MNRVGYRVFTKHYKLEAGNTPSGWDRHVLDLRALVGEDPKGLYRLKVSFDSRHLKQSCDGTRVTVAELNAWEEAQTYNDRPAESSFWDMYGGQGDWYTGYRNRGNHVTGAIISTISKSPKPARTTSSPSMESSQRRERMVNSSLL